MDPLCSVASSLFAVLATSVAGGSAVAPAAIIVGSMAVVLLVLASSRNEDAATNVAGSTFMVGMMATSGNIPLACLATAGHLVAMEVLMLLDSLRLPSVTSTSTITSSISGEESISGDEELSTLWDDETPPSSPESSASNVTREMYRNILWEKEISFRNRQLSDEEVDAMFPKSPYKILAVPSSSVQLRNPSYYHTQSRSLDEYGILNNSAGEMIRRSKEEDTNDLDAIPFIKAEDYQYFGKLLKDLDESSLSTPEALERKIMTLLLKIKNGTPSQRKLSVRTIADKAREFGAAPLFNQILPLLMNPSLEDQERHFLVKVIDSILYRLDELVRPHVHSILVVIEPMLIDDDYYARIEGGEIISNVAKAAGLATMIATMRPDIDHEDEYVRNTTARAFAVVASSLGAISLIPFLKAVCASKKAWQARHTGIKIVPTNRPIVRNSHSTSFIVASIHNICRYNSR